MIDFKKCPKKKLNTEIALAELDESDIVGRTMFAKGDEVFVLGVVHHQEATKYAEEGRLHVIYSEELRESTVVHESLLEEVDA
ncbi:hypothetical protein P4V86_15440 [Brevibacillus laterosporus]|uniref:hypothetical protein n=1 Tax=Brevibacillus laterosporus TaxID=1465 RepID=UPI0003797BB9|nr:hypothetical protein [Brevibacillus laterosporus]ATO51001.1 hypothetical protein BrL25_19010 [Brevibacillus laterosporus DSM 25]MED2004739.1 hypothetical protein [Brevibacillus laterosporus]